MNAGLSNGVNADATFIDKNSRNFDNYINPAIDF